MNHVKQKLPPRPFFARFLERQDLKQVAGSVEADPGNTDKYPSDKEDHAEIQEE